jgi:glycosyltransferase involved in cell wall biosynthesis
MRLVLVTPAYEPAWKYGGTITSNSTLCRELVKLGVSVTVYTTNASASKKPLDVPLDRPVDVGGVSVWYFKSTLGPRNNFCSRALTKKLWETVSDFDIVYVVALWQWIGIEAARACHKMNVPMVVAIKGGFSERLRRKSYFRKQAFRWLFLRKALKRAAAIHLTGPAEKDAAGSWIGDCPIVYLPNPVDSSRNPLLGKRRDIPHLLYSPDMVNPSAFVSMEDDRRLFREKWGIPLEAQVLICAARPDWKKRVDLLIGALAREKQWHLIFAGEYETGKGPQWRHYAESLGLSERVHWVGFLATRELLAAYAASDLFALVSENENFGMVVAEAMMCGLPVLISKEVGMSEYVRDQPFVLTAEFSEESVAEMLRTAEQRLPDLRTRRQDIRQCAIDQFAPERVARCFAEELQDLLSRTSPARRRVDTQDKITSQMEGVGS